MQVDFNLKTVITVGTILSALIGNVFIVGKVYSDFEGIQEKVIVLEESQNVLQIKQELLELSYKLKGIKLQIDPEYRQLCQKDMNNIVCQ